jgi:hypothetical protein
MSRDASRVGAMAGLAAACLAAACQPTVRVVAPTEPIEININLRIEQDIRVSMAPEIDALIEQNPELFD